MLGTVPNIFESFGPLVNTLASFAPKPNQVRTIGDSSLVDSKVERIKDSFNSVQKYNYEGSPSHTSTTLFYSPRMPYRRRYSSYRRRSTYSGPMRRFVRRRSTYRRSTLPGRAYSWNRRYINRRNWTMIGFGNKALKYLDTSASASVTITLAKALITTYSPFKGNVGEYGATGLVPGTAENQRIGNKILLKSIHFKANILLPASHVSSGDIVSIYCVLDTQNNTADGTSAGSLAQLFLQDDTTSSSGNISTLSVRRLDTTQRFRLLSKNTYTLNHAAGSLDSGVATTLCGQVNLPIDLYKNVHIPIEFTLAATTTGLPADCRTNCIYFVVVGTAGLAAIQQVAMRLRFYDYV